LGLPFSGGFALNDIVFESAVAFAGFHSKDSFFGLTPSTSGSVFDVFRLSTLVSGFGAPPTRTGSGGTGAEAGAELVYKTK